MTSRPPDESSATKLDEEFDSSDSYRSYLEYNKILRTWLVAFGVGGPALFLVHKEIAERLLKIGELKSVASLFLVGVACQIAGAFMNKIGNWYVYRSVEDKNNAGHCKYRVAEWLIQQFWIDIALDVVTIICFGVGVWKMLTAFAPLG